MPLADELQWLVVVAKMPTALCVSLPVRLGCTGLAARMSRTVVPEAPEAPREQPPESLPDALSRLVTVRQRRWACRSVLICCGASAVAARLSSSPIWRCWPAAFRTS